MRGTDESKQRVNYARQVRVAFLIAVWMTISISLIMYNKWLLSYRHYRFPLAMCLTHQACTAVVAHVACRTGLDGLTPPALTWQQIWRRICPIALLFAASISLSNMAAAHLTVPFMQMLKSSIPTFSLLLGFLLGVERVNLKLLAAVVGIACGVVIASMGEVAFVAEGFRIAMLGLVTEAARLILTQRLLQNDVEGSTIRFNALTGNFYTAPVATAVLAVPFLLFEQERWAAEVLPELESLLPHILCNGFMAAALNVSVFVVLKETGAVTYSIAGQVKDWMNIVIAIAVFHNAVTPLQLGGYSIAVLCVFKYKSIRTEAAAAAIAQLQAEREAQLAAALRETEAIDFKD